MTEALVCPVCEKSVQVHLVTGRCKPHPSQETKGLCGGTDLEAKDPIL